MFKEYVYVAAVAGIEIKACDTVFPVPLANVVDRLVIGHDVIIPSLGVIVPVSVIPAGTASSV